MAAGPIIRTCSLALAGAAALAAVPAFAQDPAPRPSNGIAAYVQARAADAEGAAEVAAAGYADALAQVPDDSVVAIRAYRQGLVVGDYALASRAAAVLVKADVAPPDVAILGYAMAVRSGDPAQAQRALDALAKGPLDFLAPVLGAWLALGEGRDPIPLLDKAEDNALVRRYAARHRALVLIAQGKRADGLVALQPLLGLTGENDDLRIDAALLLAATGARRQARALLAGSRADFEVLRDRLGKNLPTSTAFGASRLFLGLAVDLAEQDTLPLSILLTRAALLLDPGDDRARLYLAEALSRGGSDTLALRVLGEVGRDSPYARGAAAGTIAVLRRAGRLPEALALAKKLAADRRATSMDAQSYGELLANAGQFDAAAAAYGDALARADGDGGWMLHFLQGTALDRAGRWQEARTVLRRATALAPDEPLALSYLGSALIERGEGLAEAQALLERASKLRPDDATIADSLAWAYFKRGDVVRALPMLERAAQSDPGGAQVNEHLGDVYWQVGRRFEARYAWSAAAIHADASAATRIQSKLANGPTAAN